MKGYFGIVFYEPKWEENIGTALRSALCMGADFVADIGKRYKRQPTDTNNVVNQIPFYHYKILNLKSLNLNKSLRNVDLFSILI